MAEGSPKSLSDQEIKPIERGFSGFAEIDHSIRTVSEFDVAFTRRDGSVKIRSVQMIHKGLVDPDRPIKNMTGRPDTNDVKRINKERREERNKIFEHGLEVRQHWLDELDNPPSKR